MAPLHGGSSARKSDLCCGRSLDVVGHPGLHQSIPMPICFAGCPSPGPRKNDLTIYWALGPFVGSFTLLVDPGDIYPPQAPDFWVNLEVINPKIPGPTCRRFEENDFLLSPPALITRKPKLCFVFVPLEVGISFCRTLNFIGCTGGAPNGSSPRASSRFLENNLLEGLH
jgi:hypothetical protein